MFSQNTISRADARIILEGVKTEVFKQRTKESNYVVWQKQLNQGSRTETLTLPSVTGTVNTPFRAPGGITVQIPEGEADHLHVTNRLVIDRYPAPLAYLRADALAGLTVAIVALPLSMAIAIASGVGPERGLFTTVIGGFLVSLLGGSRFQIGGPAGAFIAPAAGPFSARGQLTWQVWSAGAGTTGPPTARRSSSG